MNSDLLWPVVRESLEFLRRHEIEPLDLVGPGPDHHFSGFGLWFRNRFIFTDGAELNGFFIGCPDSVSGWMRRLIARHGEADEATWRKILAEEEDFVSLTSLSYTRKAISLAECHDDEL